MEQNDPEDNPVKDLQGTCGRRIIGKWQMPERTLWGNRGLQKKGDRRSPLHEIFENSVKTRQPAGRSFLSRQQAGRTGMFHPATLL
jgi:hypothetical protein